VDILRLFENADNVESFPWGSVIFTAGETGNHMYVVLEGEVELRKGDKVLNVIGPGSLLGEMALVGNHERTATAVARSDCRLVPVNERKFTFLVQETPFFALHVMKILAERIVQKEKNES